jgi:MoaA/NifB/PqqE/SkfB family radical SAM enzyme
MVKFAPQGAGKNTEVKMETSTATRTQLHEVFYYITFVCGLRCRHCYVGDNLAANTHADTSQLLKNLERYRNAGASKIIFLGGEPTLHPDYQRILVESGQLGFERIIADTSGVGKNPLPLDDELRKRLTIRFSFEGIDARSHDAIRGPGMFARTLQSLRNVAAENVTVEVTFTLSAANIDQALEAISLFTAEHVHEVNFHFLSRTGQARTEENLGLDPAAVLRAQDQLESARRSSGIRVRYPRLLVRREHLEYEIQKGCECGLFQKKRVLVFPDGETRRCPLEITANLLHHPVIPEPPVFQGCPLSTKMFPSGLPEELVMTCISWKNHNSSFVEGTI